MNKNLPAVLGVVALLASCRASSSKPQALRPAPRAHPLVIAHRGFSWIAPENTLASFRAALETGVEMAECDVYLSRDGVPVVIHDSELKRTTGAEGTVNEKTSAELALLDAGSWKSRDFRGERIPTLVELLRLVKGKLRLVIEIKQEGIEKEVIEAIRDAGVDPDAVMIFSFKYDTVRNIARQEPLLPTTWLIDKLPEDAAGRRQTLREALRARASAIGLPRDRAFPEFIRRAHECGLPVFVWVVNETADMEHLVEIGVDAIITDRPDLALGLLGAGEARATRDE